MLNFYEIIEIIITKRQGKTAFFTYFFLTVISFSLFSQDTEQQPQKISFFELNEWANSHPTPHNIQIRGFLYETPNHTLILAAEPNLKCCCIGNIAKQNKQIVVLGEIGQQHDRRNAMTLAGTLNINPHNDIIFTLENAVVVNDADKNATQVMIMMGIVCGIILMVLVILKINKFKANSVFF